MMVWSWMWKLRSHRISMTDLIFPVIMENKRGGYPEGELDRLRETAASRFNVQMEEHGPGKNWIDDEPRWHIWKACDELFQARDYCQIGESIQAEGHFADALNHMLFAMECTVENNDEEDSWEKEV